MTAITFELLASRVPRHVSFEVDGRHESLSTNGTAMQVITPVPSQVQVQTRLTAIGFAAYVTGIPSPARQHLENIDSFSDKNKYVVINIENDT